ncbi:hypothetical protein CRE_25522 [Caenorhabditis remanei]|uniref:Uncharacterized protein n=1 Tax=Caenorhabditis remanei TaxID=31234 RepID=E3LS15_CAERE|nr:hypothetical protein CRE_25522 [Caenorhabditis remanei]
MPRESEDGKINLNHLDINVRSPSLQPEDTKRTSDDYQKLSVTSTARVIYQLVKISIYIALISYQSEYTAWKVISIVLNSVFLIGHIYEFRNVKASLTPFMILEMYPFIRMKTNFSYMMITVEALFFELILLELFESGIISVLLVLTWSIVDFAFQYWGHNTWEIEKNKVSCDLFRKSYYDKESMFWKWEDVINNVIVDNSWQIEAHDASRYHNY